VPAPSGPLPEEKKLSLSECKFLLGESGETMSEQGILTLRDQFELFASILCDHIQQKASTSLGRNVIRGMARWAEAEVDDRDFD
jgi:hypothetical protein